MKAPEKVCLQKIADEGVIVEKEPLFKHAYRLVETRKPILRTRSFHDGLFYVQDKASCLAVEVADHKPGDTVLDVCAAPGAKTTYVAQIMQNEGEICSVDYSRRRIREWKRETTRMGVRNSMIIMADAQKSLPLNETFDMVFLDPPCTSTGAFGKTPSAKWRLTKRSVFNMAQVQWNMLNSGAFQVREGGHLLYSTCSVTLEENEMLIERFLKWHPEFQLVDAVPGIGVGGFRGLDKCQRLYPQLHNCNGFFVAKLVKEKSA